MTTITSSTNLSDEDIEKAVKEAEQFAEEDKKAREAVDVKNRAESIIFQSEKTLSELGDKADPADAEDVKNAIEKLKETLKSGDVEAIKADTEAVEKSFYKISEKLYAQQAQAGGAEGFDPNAGAQGGDGTYYDASYEDNTNK